VRAVALRATPPTPQDAGRTFRVAVRRSFARAPWRIVSARTTRIVLAALVPCSWHDPRAEESTKRRGWPAAERVRDVGPASTPIRVRRPVCQQPLDHCQAALAAAPAQAVHSWKADVRVVEVRSQPLRTAARDPRVTGVIVEDVDRGPRDPSLGKRFGRPRASGARGEVARNCRGEGRPRWPCRHGARLDRGTTLLRAAPQLAVTDNHPLECHPGDAHRKVEGMGRSGRRGSSSIRTISRAPARGGSLHDRSGVCRTQADPVFASPAPSPSPADHTTSEDPSPDPTLRAHDHAPGHVRWPFLRFASAAPFPPACSSTPGGLAEATWCEENQGPERPARRSPCGRSAPREVASIARRGKCPSHRLASAGVIGEDRRGGVFAQHCVGTLLAC